MAANCHLIILSCLLTLCTTLEKTSNKRCIWVTKEEEVSQGKRCALAEVDVDSGRQFNLVYPSARTHDNECKLKQNELICQSKHHAAWCPWGLSTEQDGSCLRRRLCNCPPPISPYSQGCQQSEELSHDVDCATTELQERLRRSAVDIPRKCSWTDWKSVSDTQCSWHNASVRFASRFVPYQVSQIVYFCAQVLKQRERICEGVTTPIQTENMYRQIDHFSEGNDPYKDHPKAHRTANDPCKDESCPALDGQWCYWTVDTSCDYLCQQASRNTSQPVILTKSRQCFCPPPKNGGKSCIGNITEMERCICGNSIITSIAAFMRTTEGILVTLGVVVVMVIVCTCCISRLFCNDDDGSDDFKIPDYPSRRHSVDTDDRQDPGLLVSLTDIDSYPVTQIAPSLLPTDFTNSMLVPPPLPPKRYKMRKRAPQAPSNCSGSTTSSTCT